MSSPSEELHVIDSIQFKLVGVYFPFVTASANVFGYILLGQLVVALYAAAFRYIM